MKSHELARLLLKGPDLPVHSECNGYDIEVCPEVKHIGLATLMDGEISGVQGKTHVITKVILLCEGTIFLEEEIV
jgi:hypothetical protein